MSFSEAIERAKGFLHKRKSLYCNVFDKESVAAQAVLADLSKFCRANESCFHEDPRAHAVLEGRREVFLRISHHLELDQDALWKLYGRKDLE